MIFASLMNRRQSERLLSMFFFRIFTATTLSSRVSGFRYTPSYTREKAPSPMGVVRRTQDALQKGARGVQALMMAPRHSPTPHCCQWGSLNLPEHNGEAGAGCIAPLVEGCATRRRCARPLILLLLLYLELHMLLGG